jgi:methyl-accepting chemotaxis protein
MSRKSFIIKPRLQIKYLFITLLLTVISSVVIYLTLSYVLFRPERLEGLSAAEIDLFQHSFRMYFFWAVVLLVLASGLEGIYRFHRVVGPLYAIEKVIQTFSTGDFSGNIQIRKGDELTDLVEELQVMREQLKSFVQSDRSACNRIEDRLLRLQTSCRQGASVEVLEKEIEVIRAELSSITARYKI